MKTKKISTQVLSVELGDRSYPVYLGQDLIPSAGACCRRHGLPERIVILSDTNSARIASSAVLTSLKGSGFRPLLLTIPPGERQKSPERVEKIHSQMLKAGVSRDAAVMALGGGVVGDVAGLVASTYRRGLILVQCPTTFLSQVDSSVGGKNGVNYPASKNAIGTFWQPAFVLSDVGLLQTLPRRELISGLGEVLKYAFTGDPGLLGTIVGSVSQILNADPGTMLSLTERCLRIKTNLVSLDERELLPSGGRAILNVGHTVGHTLEALSNFRLRHGEGVFLGLMIEGHIAGQRGWIASEITDQLFMIYHNIRAQFSLRGISHRSIARSIFRKGNARFVLPRHPHVAAVVHDVSEHELLSALEAVVPRLIR